MISAKFLWGNVFFGGKLQIDAKNSNFEIFESVLYLKSVSMPLRFIHVHDSLRPSTYVMDHNDFKNNRKVFYLLSFESIEFISKIIV